jgi:hypothetical protein
MQWLRDLIYIIKQPWVLRRKAKELEKIIAEKWEIRRDRR